MNCALVMGAAVLIASNTDALRRGGRAYRNTQVCLQGRDMSLTFTCIWRKSGICKSPAADIESDVMSLEPVSLEIPRVPSCQLLGDVRSMILY